jgi:hypothetical protein
MTYCPETRRLASVGVGFIQVWAVGEDCRLATLLIIHAFTNDASGSLTNMPTEPTRSAYTPRFVRFIEEGRRVMIGYLDTREM